MIFLLFLSVNSIIIFLNYRKQKNIINPISLLMAPYLLLVFFNNTIAYRIGFYKVDDRVLIMYSLSFIFYYIGIILSSINDKKIYLREDYNKFRFLNYKVNLMANVLLGIGLISLIKLFYLIKNFSFPEIEGMMGNGVIGHLVLLSYSLAPIVFLYWLYNKKKIKYLVAIILILIVTFSTFIKYNVIGFIINIFIFTSLYKKSVLKKAVLILLIFVFGLFISNYAINFYFVGVNASTEFYLRHFLTYVLGSIINSNHIFLEGVNTHLSLFYKIMIFIFALPNMFFNKIIGKVFFPWSIATYDFYPISDSESSNVIDAIGYLYPSYGSEIEIVIFYIFMLVIGFIFYKIYINSIKKIHVFNTLISNFMTYFIFLSFFGTFYMLPSPWEILIYSIFVPKLFLKKFRKEKEKNYGKNTIFSLEERNK